ncbi:hypothetical protein TGARI_215710D [Toxoplasma gondii ARI]|uniref:Uncharacterized protein n=1 Tax=Toxoplasma gondii ARI TaxID=1074872 RepID=A0A139XVH4_TOXGO|nr:hypothetical protein TGARI_215710D [Toxoplasma gondii ARI]
MARIREEDKGKRTAEDREGREDSEAESREVEEDKDVEESEEDDKREDKEDELLEDEKEEDAEVDDLEEDREDDFLEDEKEEDADVDDLEEDKEDEFLEDETAEDKVVDDLDDEKEDCFVEESEEVEDLAEEEKVEHVDGTGTHVYLFLRTCSSGALKKVEEAAYVEQAASLKTQLPLFLLSAVAVSSQGLLDAGLLTARFQPSRVQVASELYRHLLSDYISTRYAFLSVDQKASYNLNWLMNEKSIKYHVDRLSEF